MRIIFVHGIAQGGKKPGDLKATWVKTMREGFRATGRPWPEMVEFDFPYYGDLLDRFVTDSRLPAAKDVLAKGPGQNKEFELFMQSALGQIQQERIPDSEVRAHLDPGNAQEKGPQNWAWVRAIARAIDDRLTPASSFTIEMALREAFVYVSKPAATRQIDAVVEKLLTNEPTIVVGHSLGSVVAYNVIKKRRARLDLKKFITVGSPLGIRAISSKLGIPENLAGADAWYNAYDHRDIVALNPLDNTYFPTEPSIINYNKVNNKTDNRHGIIGYLNDSTVAMQIAVAVS